MSSTKVPKTTKSKAGKHRKLEPRLLLTVLERTTVIEHSLRLKKRKDNNVICEPTIVVGDLPELDESTLFDPAFLNSKESPDTLGLTPDEISSFEFDVDVDIDV